MTIKEIFHLKRIRWVMAVSLMSLVAIPAIAALTGTINRYVERMRMTRFAYVLESGIAQEELAMAHAAQSIANDLVARKLATTIDADVILPIIEADQKNTVAAGVVFVDDRGVVVARTHALQEWGDYIYETTSYGRTMAQGHDFASVETGSVYPLIINSGHLIKDDSGATLAGVIAGRWFDDDYVRDIKDKYLGKNGVQLVVYSNQFGVMGSSFDSAADRAQATKLFNINSDLLRGDMKDAVVPITIGNAQYIGRRVSFNGTENSSGGAFILVPYNYVSHAVSFSALLVTIVWLLLFFHLSYRKSFFSKVIDGALLGVGAVIVFFISFHANILAFQYKAPIINGEREVMYNSILNIYPPASIFSGAFEKFVSVQLVSGGESINAIRAHLKFDQRVVSIEKLDVAGTLCENGVVLDSVVDEINGTVLFSCVIPGGYQGSGGVVVRALLHPIGAGDASLSFLPDSQVLANDGLGTNVLRFASGGNYVVGGPADPLRLLVFSPSHSNENQWYPSRDVTFSWNAALPKDAVYRYALDQNPLNDFSQDDAVSTTTNLSVHLSVPNDGDWYFHVAAVAGSVAGPTATLPIRIDATPPRQPIILLSDASVSVGEVVRLAFGSEDETSGLQKNFYIAIDNQPTFLPAASPLFIPFVDAGQHAITVRAIDNAGNRADATVYVSVTSPSWWDRLMVRAGVNQIFGGDEEN
ncbi:MAG: hypothetical protein WC246_00660 [Candidatus Paceibacterota bacterium]|jgi:hypothetical protein